MLVLQGLSRYKTSQHLCKVVVLQHFSDHGKVLITHQGNAVVAVDRRYLGYFVCCNLSSHTIVTEDMLADGATVAGIVGISHDSSHFPKTCCCVLT